MNHAELLKRLLPPEAYDANAPLLTVELTAEGNALDAAQRAADKLLDEAFPLTAYSLLSDWERNAGVSGAGLSVDQRRAQIDAKMNEKGMQSRGYFLAIAARFGFPNATITEYRRATCNDNCNVAIWGPDALFVWTITLPATGGVFRATCNSNCNAALQSWGHSLVEGAISEDRPAHTTVLFAYV